MKTESRLPKIKRAVQAKLLEKGLVATTNKNKRGSAHVTYWNAERTKSAHVRITVNKYHYPLCRWTLRREDIERFASSTSFFVLAKMLSDNDFAFFVVPSLELLNYAKGNERQWLETRRKSGGLHKDIKLCHFRDDEEKYLNRWDLLDLK